MKLVAGLGNPGADYKGTPHNVGFETVEMLARRAGLRFRSSLRFHAELAKGALGGQALTLMKPRTFMNVSGEAVMAWLRYHRATVADLVVVVDDADLEVGRIRIRAKGSSGGHNGLESIILHTGSDAFVRIRLGVGRGDGGRSMVAHVLSPFPTALGAPVEDMIDRAATAVEDVIRLGVDRAMNRYNAVAAAEEKAEKE